MPELQHHLGWVVGVICSWFVGGELGWRDNRTFSLSPSMRTEAAIRLKVDVERELPLCLAMGVACSRLSLP